MLYNGAVFDIWLFFDIHAFHHNMSVVQISHLLILLSSIQRRIVLNIISLNKVCSQSSAVQNCLLTHVECLMLLICNGYMINQFLIYIDRVLTLRLGPSSNRRSNIETKIWKYLFGDVLSKIGMKSFSKICRSESTLKCRSRHSYIKWTHTI